MNILKTVRQALNRVTLDEVLAISPNFMDRVETAEAQAIEAVETAEEETRKAAALMEAASLKSKKAKRVTKAVARVRQINGG